MFSDRSRRFLAAISIVGLAALVAAEGAFAQSRGTLAGVVLDANGKPVPGARVTLQPSDARAGRVTTTNAEGRFAFNRVYAVLYDVRAYASGLSSDWTRLVAVRPNQRAEITLKLKPAEAPPKPSAPATSPPAPGKSPAKPQHGTN